MFQKRKMALAFLLITCMVFMTPSMPKAEKAHQQKPITIMYYCDADNNLEPDLLEDIDEMKAGVTDEVNLITLVDRHDRYTSNSKTLGEDFDDMRLYEITPNKATRIDGGTQFKEITTTSTDFEGNMGDAHTLKNFIEYGKEHYPADQYVLILSNHGGGPRTDDKHEGRKAICWDETNGDDTLYTGEISDVLTKEDSVDVFGLDACFMGNAEFAYQFHKENGGFEADIMVACATSEWDHGWKYDTFLDRLQTKKGNNGEEDETFGGMEKYYSPKTITPSQIGGVIVEEQRDSCEGITTDQTLACYDLSKVVDVKEAVDDFSIALKGQKNAIEKLRGNMDRPNIMYYFAKDDLNDQVYYPFFDLYDLARKVKSKNTYTVTSLVYEKDVKATETVTANVYDKALNLNNPQSIKDCAQKVMDEVNDMVLYSYGGRHYKNFRDGKNGLSIFFPKGDEMVYANRGYHRVFEFQYWYSPLDLTQYLNLGDDCYGKLKWCQDGLDKKIDSIGNWFELLDSWYDKNNNQGGGVNDYRW